MKIVIVDYSSDEVETTYPLHIEAGAYDDRTAIWALPLRPVFHGVPLGLKISSPQEVA